MKAYTGKRSAATSKRKRKPTRKSESAPKPAPKPKPKPAPKPVPKTARAQKLRIARAKSDIRNAKAQATRARARARKQKTKVAYQAAREAEARSVLRIRAATADINKIQKQAARSGRGKQKAIEERTRKAVAKVVEAQQKARGKSKRSAPKKRARELKKKVAKSRARAALVTHGPVPEQRQTPTEKAEAKRTVREEMLSRFQRFKDHARKTKQFPDKERSGGFTSARSVGEQRYVKVERVLDDGTIETILYRVRSASKKLPGNRPMWYARIDLAGMGDALFASGQRMLDTTGLTGDTSFAEFFQTQGFDSTGIWNTRQSMLVRLEHMLEEYAATPNTIVYLHGILIRNYDARATRVRT